MKSKRGEHLSRSWTDGGGFFSSFFQTRCSTSGPPPPPPPRDSLVYDSPLEEAARSSKRVSVNKGKVSYDGDHDKSDRFDERGSDRFDEPVHAPPPPIPFEPVKVSAAFVRTVV